mmetsp:Transcript_16817/g.63780  ORF Transcript_16817/g.63780 Transcript_16817/m.63780 type:complete len:239 (+) Transcript_16817:180-896(+)
MRVRWENRCPRLVYRRVGGRVLQGGKQCSRCPIAHGVPILGPDRTLPVEPKPNTKRKNERERDVPVCLRICQLARSETRGRVPPRAAGSRQPLRRTCAAAHRGSIAAKPPGTAAERPRPASSCNAPQEAAAARRGPPRRGGDAGVIDTIARVQLVIVKIVAAAARRARQRRPASAGTAPLGCLVPLPGSLLLLEVVDHRLQLCHRPDHLLGMLAHHSPLGRGGRSVGTDDGVEVVAGS